MTASEIPGWGDLLTRVTIWLALLGYMAGPAAALLGRDRERWQRVARTLYSLGLAAFLVHVVAAFHFFYRWSHAVALAETARETAAVTGVASGTGLYLNYVFTLLWIADVLWWWKVGARDFPRRAPWIGGVLHGFFLFMAFNATVVFEQGSVRWAGLAGTVLLAVIFLRACSLAARGPRETSSSSS